MPDAVKYYSCSPPQFVKRAKAREERQHHLVDLKHFLDWIAEEMQDFPVETLSPEDRESLVAEYLELDDA
jgi:hypothetical protein